MNGWLLLPLYIYTTQTRKRPEGHDFTQTKMNHVLASEIIAVQDYENPEDPERPCARFSLRNVTVGYADMSADALMALVLRETGNFDRPN